MNLWQTFSQMFTRTSKKYSALFLPDYRVDVCDDDSTPIREGEAYCRLWLVEMRLAKDVEWAKSRYPIVHAATCFQYGGQQVTIPYLAGPKFIKGFTQENLDRVIQYNYPLTPLFPFNRGLVELQAGLFSLVVNDPIQKFITVMERFSKLLPVPEIASVLKIAAPVYSGIEDLLGAGERELKLGYQQTFSAAGGGGSNDLRSGYFVAMLAPQGSIDTQTLCIVDDSLRIGAKGRNKEFITDHHPLDGYSYMLFRWEKREYQDWESLSTIKKLVDQAQDAVLVKKFDDAKIIVDAIKSEIFRSTDITKKDRWQLLLKIKAHLRKLALHTTGGTEVKPSLYAIMQQPMPEVDETTRAELATLERIFAL